MSSSGSMTIGVVAIFSGLLGAYGLRALFLPDPPPPPEPPPTITVPLAAAELPVGRRIVLGDVALHRMTQAQMVERDLADSSVMLSAEQIIGRVLSEPVEQGKPFLTTSLFLEGGQPNVSDSLRPGFRAVSLEIPVIRGGMTTPGTLVDVLFRSEAQSGPADPRVQIPEATVTLFEGVEVVALVKPQSYRENNSGNLDIRFRNRAAVRTTLPRVTLAVTLQQANVLRTVEGRGEITLVPRAAGEQLAFKPALPAAGSGLLSEALAAREELAAETALEQQASEEAADTSTVIGSASTLQAVIQPLKSMTLEGLLGLKPPAEPFRTEIYRRGSRQVHMFDGDGQPVSSTY